MAEKYVEARIEGHNKKKSKEIAGYAEGTKTTDIERPGGPVARKMLDALKKKGIDENYLAKEYVEGIDLAKQPDAKGRDGNAHAKYLFQVAHLLGYGKKENPQVAIQVNNGKQSEELDEDSIRRSIAKTEELAEGFARLTKMVEKAIGDRNASGVSEGDSGTGNPPSHSRVVEPIIEAEEAGGGGES